MTAPRAKGNLKVEYEVPALCPKLYSHCHSIGFVAKIFETSVHVIGSALLIHPCEPLFT